MSINVYWCCVNDQWMLAKEPAPVLNKFYNNFYYDNSPLASINNCPAFNYNLNNVYELKSIYNYNFFIENDCLRSNLYDQNFFDKHVVIRNFKNKFFSFNNSYIFFTEEESLETNFYEYPFLEDNNVTKRCIIVPGKFDIGKWFRNTEFAFYLKKDFNEFKIEEEEVYSYIRFNTKEKIKFIQFRFSNKLKEYQQDGFAINGFAKNFSKYYKSFKLKNKILEEIKNNLI